MATASKIEWTDQTWNPLVGCTPVSPGCKNCYAATMARRLEAMGRPEYAPRVEPARMGTPFDSWEPERTVRIAEVRGGRAVFTGDVRTVPERLADPLGWRKPRRVFVDSMSDLFHEAVPFEFIDRVFAVMALTPRHTYQVLTKRPERMAEYLAAGEDALFERWADAACPPGGVTDSPCAAGYVDDQPWPLPNVWLGTSVEDQARADERIPHLLRCPAAVRFLSCEPMLGAVALDRWLPGQGCNRCQTVWPGREPQCPQCSPLDPMALATHERAGVDWVIVGGESGPNARPCDVGWIRGVVEQCKGAGVPVFVKQLGRWSSGPHPAHWPVHQWLLEDGDRRGVFTTPILRAHYATGPDTGHEAPAHAIAWNMGDPKGGDPAQWPEDLRVREFPAVAR